MEGKISERRKAAIYQSYHCSLLISFNLDALDNFLSFGCFGQKTICQWVSFLYKNLHKLVVMVKLFMSSK